MGAANAAAGISQGFPIGASGSRTAVNDNMGAHSQVAGFVSAATVAVILIFLTEPVQYLPKTVLAAVIVSAALGLFDSAAWRALAVVDRVEVAIAAVTTVCVVGFGVLQALVVAVGLSMIDTVRRSATPHDAVLGHVERLGRYADVAVHRSAHVTPGVVVYRLDDRLFFANARYFKGACAGSDPRRAGSGVVARLRRRSRHPRRHDRSRRARHAHARIYAEPASRSWSPGCGPGCRMTSTRPGSPPRSVATSSIRRSMPPSTQSLRSPAERRAHGRDRAARRCATRRGRRTRRRRPGRRGRCRGTRPARRRRPPPGRRPGDAT